jgi:hypothetical protein
MYALLAGIALLVLPAAAQSHPGQLAASTDASGALITSADPIAVTSYRAMQWCKGEQYRAYGQRCGEIHEPLSRVPVCGQPCESAVVYFTRLA